MKCEPNDLCVIFAASPKRCEKNIGAMVTVVSCLISAFGERVWTYKDPSRTIIGDIMPIATFIPEVFLMPVNRGAESQEITRELETTE